MLFIEFAIARSYFLFFPTRFFHSHIPFVHIVCVDWVFFVLPSQPICNMQRLNFVLYRTHVIHYFASITHRVYKNLLFWHSVYMYFLFISLIHQIVRICWLPYYWSWSTHFIVDSTRVFLSTCFVWICGHSSLALGVFDCVLFI